jgi:predicted RNA binding protein YcfA (HicA-like mRNA interferase family)
MGQRGLRLQKDCPVHRFHLLVSCKIMVKQSSMPRAAVEQRNNLQIRARELIRALERLGWYVDRQRRHAVMRHPDRPGSVPIPIHPGRPLKPGTLRQILKMVGIDEEQLNRLL